jgi:hypothetical protein
LLVLKNAQLNTEQYQYQWEQYQTEINFEWKFHDAMNRALEFSNTFLTLWSTAACLLWLWVRIPLGHGHLFSEVVVCRQVEFLRRADHCSRGVLPSVVFECDHKSSIMRKSWPTRVCCNMGKNVRMDVVGPGVA